MTVTASFAWLGLWGFALLLVLPITPLVLLVATHQVLPTIFVYGSLAAMAFTGIGIEKFAGSESAAERWYRLSTVTFVVGLALAVLMYGPASDLPSDPEYFRRD